MIEISQDNMDVFVEKNTDKYFSKSRTIVELNGDVTVTYGVFMRRDVICAIEPALNFLRTAYHVEAVTELAIKRHFEEGAIVPSGKCIFTYTGSMRFLVELETILLQYVGITCVSAHNAYNMVLALPQVAFLDMHARHAGGPQMTSLAAYGASVGSKTAKLVGAKGFIGSSTDRNAVYFGTERGIGTMPHAIIGYAGSTLTAAQMYADAHPGESLTVLVDYFGREYTDAAEVAEWWLTYCTDHYPNATPPRLGFRLDTHGGRFAEGLDYAKSVEIVCNWLHCDGEYDAVRAVMGNDVYNADDSNVTKDRVRKILFGPGVSAANIIRMHEVVSKMYTTLERPLIVASSGFNLFKCKTMSSARAPIDVVGTGSFLPETFSETYATADIFKYGNEFSVKVGREKIFKGL